jgi:Phytanoyl-CoA dioxygenase (PhyH)
VTQTFTLTNQHREDFERTGLLRLEGLLSADRVNRAREAVLRPLERLGLWRDGAWRLDSRPKPQWPDAGLKVSRVIGNRRPELEALIEEPALSAAVDMLLEGRPFDRGIYKRPQLLFTLPNAETWTLPAGWHLDVPRLASGEAPGVQLFTFLDAVGPGGGGTLVITGSHRLLNDGRFHKTGKVMRALRREAFFRDLCSGALDGGDLPGGAVGDVPLQVVELTGAPGDAWLMDLRLLHTGAPNAAERPRMMATHRFLRADLVAEVSRGFDWAGNLKA